MSTTSTHQDGIHSAIVAASPITRPADIPELDSTLRHEVAQRQVLLDLSWSHLEKSITLNFPRHNCTSFFPQPAKKSCLQWLACAGAFFKPELCSQNTFLSW